MADNILNAQKLAIDCRHFDVIGMAVTINDQVVHPPLYSILALPFMLAIRDPRTAIYCLNGVMFCTLIVLVFAAAYRSGLSPSDGSSPGDKLTLAITASVLGVGSILARVFSEIAMTELTGAVFVIGSAVAAIEADRSSTKKWYILTGICMSLAFLTKYSYGIFALPSVLWLAMRNALANRIPGRLTALAGFLLLPIAVGSFGCLVNSCNVRLLGMFRISERGLSNVLYAMIICAGIGAACLRNRMNGLWRDRSALFRALILSAAVPVWIWLILPTPNRILGMIRFFRNRASIYGHLDGLWFYPRVVIQDYDIRPWIGVLVVSGAIAAAAWQIIGAIRRRSEENGLYCYSFFCGLIVVASHCYKLERNLLPVLPLLWICSSWGILRTLHFVHVRKAGTRLFAVLIAVAILFGLTEFGWVPERLNTYSAMAESDRIIDAIIQNLDLRGDNHIWGTNNHISRPAILSRCLERGIQEEVLRFDLRKPKYESGTLRAFSDQDEAEKNFQIWLKETGRARVFVIEMREECSIRDDDYLRWNKWKEAYTRLLRLSPEFTMTAHLSFCGDQILLDVLDRY